MMEIAFFFLLAALSGMSMAIQGSLNSVLGEVTGELEATFVVHIIGLILLVVMLFILQFGTGKIDKVFSAPWYSYLGGALNILILYGVMYSIPRLGVSNATTAIVTAQVLTAVVIDHFGFWGLEQIPFRWLQLVGLLFLAVGVKLLVRVP
jgi:transporter family-2 protein